ncbi:SDR family oxidoreductase [Edaphobacter aggregans]|uniref:SDR family oxidoreductase n=1 Tax=Edaphobacter aggregans TaxID=570835 RepID=UPI000553F9CB|nr:SDR family oxidoreductase [Edaphobacter aggregans]
MSTQKVALISGANKGIGFETARQLGKKGIVVFLGARDLAKGEAAAEQLKKEGIDARAVKFDVVNPADVKAAAERIEKEFGRLDILVNNAGVMMEPIGGNNSSSVSEEILRKTFETNFFSVVTVTNEFLPLLKKSDAGRIVNVSSILGSLTLHATEGSPIYEAKALAYDSSKTAQNAYTVHLAHELKGTKIKVNSAHPGWVKTDMGTDAAPMDVVDGAKTEVELATLGADGPTGGFFHMGQPISW